MVPVDLRNLRIMGVVSIGVGHQRNNGSEDFGDVQGWRPLLGEDVQFGSLVLFHVQVVDLRSEGYTGCIAGIVPWEIDVKFENASSVRSVFRTFDSSFPPKNILLINWTRLPAIRFFLTKVD